MEDREAAQRALRAANDEIRRLHNRLVEAYNQLQLARDTITSLQAAEKRHIEEKQELRKAMVAEISNMDRPEPTSPPPPKDREAQVIGQILDILAEVEAVLGTAVSRRIANYVYQRYGN